MFENPGYRMRLRWLILLTALLRCICACLVDLGNDEVYYFTYALQPDWNHFDHPPIIGFLIRFFTLNLHWLNTFSMRIGAIVSAAAGTYLVASCGKMLKNERTGWIAAVLYNASIYTSIISGLFILPDSPAVVFWLAAIYCMLRMLRMKDDRLVNKYLLLTGAWIGLAAMSKIHGLFLWIGFGGYIIFYDPRWLRKINLYLALLITALIVSPVIFWNVQNDFITWQFHSNRVTINSGIHPGDFITALAGTFFYNNPLCVILIAWCMAPVVKGRHFVYLLYRNLLLWCGLPIILVTLVISLFRSVLPHWSGPGFIPLTLLTAVWIDKKIALTNHKRYALMVSAAAWLTIVILIAGIIVVRYYPGTTGQKTAMHLGADDVTLDMYGWKELLPVFTSLTKEDEKNKMINPGAPLLVNKWFPGGHLCFYVAHPLGMSIIGSGPLEDLHKFAWLNKDQGNIPKGGDAYFIAPSNYFADPAVVYKDSFESITLAKSFCQKRGGEPARYWYIYRLKGAKYAMGD